MSPLFGAALWTMDYALRAAAANIKRTYFHHGTIGACYYCFWGRYDTGAPYYGAYVATAAMAGGSYISALDFGSTNYGGYVTYDSAKTPLRALLYNSDYYSGSGARGSVSFVLSGLGAEHSRPRGSQLPVPRLGSTKGAILPLEDRPLRMAPVRCREQRHLSPLLSLGAGNVHSGGI